MRIEGKVTRRKSKRGKERGRERRGRHPAAPGPTRGVLHPQSRTFDLLIIGLYLLLVVVLFREFLFSNTMLFGTDSIPSGVFFRGMYRDFVRQYHGLPRWDPYILGGLPFIDAMHGDTFYPTSLLKFFMPLHRAMGLKLVLHVFLAGLFMYLFLKTLKLNRYAAAFGGLGYMFASVFVSLVYAGHDAKMFIIALLPLVFSLLERGFETKRLFYFIMLGGAIGLLILSSHVQMAYFALWGVGLYLLFRLALICKENKEPRRVVGKIFVYFILAIVIGLGFGLVQLLPSYVYVHNYSVREQKTGFDHATSWSLHAEEIGSLVVPEFAGDNVNRNNTYWGRNPFKLNTEYVGLVSLIFAAFALLVIRTKRIIFFSIIALLAVVYGLGGDTPIFYLFYYLVPGVKIFRGPSMIMFLFSFAICLMGAVGFHSLVEHSFEKKRQEKVARGLTAACGAVLVLGILLSLMKSGLFSLWASTVYTEMTPQKHDAMLANMDRFVTGLWIAVFLFLASSGLIWARLKGKISSLAFLGLVVPLVLIDTWRIDAQFIKAVDPKVYLGRDRTINFLQQMGGKDDPFRVFPVGRAYGENVLGVHRIESVTGFHDNELKWFNGFTRRDRRNLIMSPFMDLLNVRYVLWDPREKAFQRYFDQMEKAGRLRMVFDGGRVRVYENTGALPRAWVASQYEVMKGEQVLERLADPTFDYRNTVLLEEDPGVEMGGADTLGVGQVDGIEYVGNRIEIRVIMNRPGFLVLSDNYFPYWHAWVDGQESKIYKADYTLRAVWLDEGEHLIEFSYRSRPFKIGLWSACLTALFLLGAVVVEINRRLRKKTVKNSRAKA